MKKRDSRECFCALCRTPRKLRYPRHLSFMNYFQILIMAVGLGAVAFPWIGVRAVIVLPIIWVIFEGMHKSLYRKDLKCPFCGFDPTWYKKDVNLARRKVEEFLKQNPESHVLRRRHTEEKPPTEYL
ncbi:MAG TPA: hypothetical protein VNJ08_14230 [Bacteriovoracaceae bacterium]|nr:hypothetical protein [Bacteriovoracaceae bacterium]